MGVNTSGTSSESPEETASLEQIAAKQEQQGKVLDEILNELKKHTSVLNEGVEDC